MLLEKVIKQGKSRPGEMAIIDDRRTLTFGQLRPPELIDICRYAGRKTDAVRKLARHAIDDARAA